MRHVTYIKHAIFIFVIQPLTQSGKVLNLRELWDPQLVRDIPPQKEQRTLTSIARNEVSPL